MSWCQRIVEGTAPPTIPTLTIQRNNVFLPTVHALVSIVTVLVIALLLLIIFIVYLYMRKLKKTNLLIRSTEAVKVRTSLSLQEREDTSLSLQDVMYEEIAERSDMLFKEAHVIQRRTKPTSVCRLLNNQTITLY